MTPSNQIQFEIESEKLQQAIHKEIISKVQINDMNIISGEIAIFLLPLIAVKQVQLLDFQLETSSPQPEASSSQPETSSLITKHLSTLLETAKIQSNVKSFIVNKRPMFFSSTEIIFLTIPHPTAYTNVLDKFKLGHKRDISLEIKISPIMLAVIFENEFFMSHFVNQKSDYFPFKLDSSHEAINQRNKQNWLNGMNEALIAACLFNKVKMAKLLIDSFSQHSIPLNFTQALKIKITTKEPGKSSDSIYSNSSSYDFNFTPIFLATAYASNEIVKLLLCHGVQPNLQLVKEDNEWLQYFIDFKEFPFNQIKLKHIVGIFELSPPFNERKQKSTAANECKKWIIAATCYSQALEKFTTFFSLESNTTNNPNLKSAKKEINDPISADSKSPSVASEIYQKSAEYLTKAISECYEATVVLLGNTILNIEQPDSSIIDFCLWAMEKVVQSLYRTSPHSLQRIKTAKEDDIKLFENNVITHFLGNEFIFPSGLNSNQRTEYLSRIIPLEFLEIGKSMAAMKGNNTVLYPQKEGVATTTRSETSATTFSAANALGSFGIQAPSTTTAANNSSSQQQQETNLSPAPRGLQFA